MPYQKKEIDYVLHRIQEMFIISSELEKTFPGRKFTLDGHLVGSIGEVIAAFYYGLELLPSSTEKHDAIAVDGRLVQIKATQGMNGVSMRSKPEFLIVLWIDGNSGEVCEVYNGPGELAWDACGKWASNGTRPITISKLKKISTQVTFDQRVESCNPIRRL